MNKRVLLLGEIPPEDLLAFVQVGRRMCLFSGGGGGTQTTSTTQNFSPEESARRTQVMDEAQRIYNSSASAMMNTPYPGSQPVSQDPMTQLASQYAQSYALGPAVAQANNINNAVQFGLGDVLFPQSNQALTASIDAAIRPITQSYTDPGGVMSQIRDTATQAGGYGGSRQGIAEGVAAGRYADAIGNTASTMANENYQKGLDTFSRTLAFAPQALETGLMPSTILSGIGSQNEAYQQQLADYAAASRMWDYNAPWTPLQNYASIVFGGANPTTVSTGMSPQSGSSAAQIGGAALSALLPYIFSASDRRLKENIEEVGVDAATGLKLYEFNYKHSSGRYRGVMADDVEKYMPQAVEQDSAGFKFVNYNMLGIPFVKLS